MAGVERAASLESKLDMALGFEGERRAAPTLDGVRAGAPPSSRRWLGRVRHAAPHPRDQPLRPARFAPRHELHRRGLLARWGVAALSITFSLAAMALTRLVLPGTPWTHVIVNLGYSVGFALVVVVRQQAFDAFRAMGAPRARRAPPLLRALGGAGIVLLTNLIGAVAFASAVHRTPALSDDMKHALAAIGEVAFAGDVGGHVLRAIASGWFIAFMVRMLARTQARAIVVVVITYIVGLGELSRVVAGSAGVLYALFNGEATWLDYLVRFLLPVGFGNLLGGMALVGALGHAQATSHDGGAASRRHEPPR